jgi:hypothetical protein
MAFRRNEAWEPAFRNSGEFGRSMNTVAKELAVNIRIAAEPSRNTGYYLRRIKPIGKHVRFHDNFWHLVEYGSVNNPPYMPARKGVLMSGLRFVDDGIASI